MSRRKRYSTEFKREAIRRCNEPGVTAVLVAEELGISTRQLRRWREAAERHGEQAFPGEGNAYDADLLRSACRIEPVLKTSEVHLPPAGRRTRRQRARRGRA